MESRMMNVKAGLVAAGLAVALILACAGSSARGQKSKDATDGSLQWEYLVVGGGSSNLSTAGNDQFPNMRKQPDGSFAVELFPLERNFDKLGARGWELVVVSGQPNNPLYYFKRPKESR